MGDMRKNSKYWQIPVKKFDSFVFQLDTIRLRNGATVNTIDLNVCKSKGRRKCFRCRLIQVLQVETKESKFGVSKTKPKSLYEYVYQNNYIKKNCSIFTKKC